jgi:hypothetical protein
VKLGDALKQGRYEPAKGYIFPKANKRLYAKIDVFKLVGTQSVMVNPEAGNSAREIDMKSNDPTVDNLRLRVDMKPSSSTKMPPRNAKSFIRDQAASYLEKHKIEERLSNSMKSLLQSQPDDPIGFFCCSLQGIPYGPVTESCPTVLGEGQIRQSHEKSKLGVSRKGNECSAAEHTEEDMPLDFDAFRQALAQASTDGRLFDLLQGSEQKSTVLDASSVLPAAPRNTLADIHPNDMNNLCMRATDVLLKASRDGSLQEVLESSKSEDEKGLKLDVTDARLQALRDKACLTLISASRDGRLQSALTRTRLQEVPSTLGLPCTKEQDSCSMAGTSQKEVVLGLTDAARAALDTSHMSAAGLIQAAAEVAENLRATLNATCSIAPDVATGLAAMAMSAATAGSTTAPGLIEAAIAACVNIAQTSE